MRRTRAPPTALSPAQARQLISYDRAVLGAYVRKLRRMSPRVTNRNLEIGHGSLRQTILHVIGVYNGWLNYIARGRVAEHRRLDFRYSNYPTWPSVERFLGETFDSIEAWMRRITPQALAARVQAPWMPGHYTVSDAIRQASFEQAHHLGEIIAVLWQRDTEPPSMTWIEYTRGV